MLAQPSPPRDRLPWGRPVVWAAYGVAAVVATLQRGVWSDSHTTFPIFRQSFLHLVQARNLYAPYPLEQGAGAADLFKYSPTAAVFFGPFAVLPLPLGLLLWNLCNAVVFALAIEAILPRAKAARCLAIALPAVFAALQSSSSNALIAGLMILAFAAIEQRRHAGAAAAIAAGTLIKLFPLAGVLAAWTQPRRVRFALVLAGTFAALIALPLLVTTPAGLLSQYRWWAAVIRADSADLEFGRSIMRAARGVVELPWPNWALQVLATIVLVLPLAIRSGRTDARFRLVFFCSTLVYSVIFNHQAEHQSYVIATAGVAMWYLSRPPSPWRTALLVLCAVGFDAVPHFIAWLVMQRDLLASRERAAVPAGVVPWWYRLAGAVRLPVARSGVAREHVVAAAHGGEERWHQVQGDRG